MTVREARTTPSRGQVLVASPEPAERRGLARLLLDAGFAVLTAPDLDGVCAALRTSALDAVCLTLALAPEAAALARVRDIDRHVALGLAAANAELPRAAELARTVQGFVVALPVVAPEVVTLGFERAIGERALRAARGRERDVDVLGRGELVTASPALERLFSQAVAFAELDAPVVLAGEPGSGKRTFARALCEHGRRAASPVRLWDAASGDPVTLERALFAPVDGLLARAEGGTLVVAGLELVPLSVQEHLVAALWPRELPTRDEPADGAARDVRLLALTVAPVRKLLAARTLLPALAEHLALRLEVPPLRRRRDEIPVFAYTFLRRHAFRMGRDIRRIGTEALRRLRARDWPGNLSELDQVMAVATAACQGEVILPRDLDGLGARARVGGPIAWEELAELPYRAAKERVLTSFDASYVRRLLAATGGRRREAARRAGLDPANFRRLCHRVGTSDGVLGEPDAEDTAGEGVAGRGGADSDAGARPPPESTDGAQR